jgi:mannan endo-1,4-beta-mannosidase
MRTRIAIAAATLLALTVSMFVFASPAHAAVGLRISGRNIVEANGSNFIMRGTSHAHVWYPNQTSSFANIKSLGANTVRVVLGSGQRWGPNSASDVANVITLCKNARLICVLEVHDTTGFGEEGAAATLDQAASYWIGLSSVLMGQENYVVINLGNEPFGNNQTVSATWATATSNAIVRLRNAGFDHLIMADAPMWGQDWQGIMRDNATQVFNADPDRNTVFSIHMYGVYNNATTINNYLNAFQTAGLPLVIGEFGHNHSDGDPDEDTIMAQAQSRGLGYIGWSWSGNSGGVEYLDMVNNFNVNSLTPWGQRIFNGANGIASTSREATIYSGTGDDTTPPTTPGTPTASNVTSTGATLNWGASTDSGGSGLAGYNIYREQGATDPLLAQSTGNSVNLTGLTANTQYQVYVRARDGAGNLSANSGLATFMTGGDPLPGCRVAYSAANWGGGGGFTANVVITNTGGTAVNGWNLVWTYANGQRVTEMWNATHTQPAATVTATNMGYNAVIGANGGTVNFGLNGTWTGTNNNPTAFTLNGAACTLG